MSAEPHYQATEEAHTGPIKNPKQLLLAVFFSFVAPILIIAALVSYVVSGTHPSGAAEGESMSLYGVSKEARDREIAERLKKVGSIEIRDANRPLATGETVFKAQCVACHGSPGIPGAPHLKRRCGLGPSHRPGLRHAARACAQGQGRDASARRRRLRRPRNRPCRGLHGQRGRRQVPGARTRPAAAPMRQRRHLLPMPRRHRPLRHPQRPAPAAVANGK